MLMDQGDEQIVGTVQKIIMWAGKTVMGWVSVSFLLFFFRHSIQICTTLHYLNAWNRLLSEQILQFPSKINIPNARRNGEPVCKSTTWKSLYGIFIYLFQYLICDIWVLMEQQSWCPVWFHCFLHVTQTFTVWFSVIIISLLLFRWWWPKTHSPWRCLRAM